MILGIGIDSVDITEMQRLCADTQDAFVRKIFSASEQTEAESRSDRAQVFAGKFAVKEAVFKALGHLTSEGSFNFRIIETLEDINGYPSVTMTDEVKELLHQAGAKEILVSITNENNVATAIALVQ